jgi:hypothetical protein
MSMANRILLARGILLAGMLFVAYVGYHGAAHVWSEAEELKSSLLQFVAVGLGTITTGVIEYLGYQAVGIRQLALKLEKSRPSQP